MAGVDISSVVDKLEADLVRTREKGLEDLRYLLSSSKNNNDKFGALGDDGFHRILESLYRMVRTDKASYLKASQARTKTQSTNRLSLTATALRLTVESAASKIRFKTAISIIDHITGTLPTADQGFCEPLRNDYLKSLRILLDYSPHGEHLKLSQWQDFVDFIINGLSVSLSEDDPSAIELSGREISMTSKNGSHLSLRATQNSVQKSSRYGAKSSFDDLLCALRSLVTLTNGPVLSRASQILDIAMECLMLTQWSQDVVLEVFNAVCMILRTEDVRLLGRTVVRLAPLLYKMWSPRLPALREQILITLSILRPIFLTERDMVAYLEPQIRRKILDVVQDEYTTRPSREMLQFDDLVVKLSALEAETLEFSMNPKQNSSRAVSLWSLLVTMASLVTGLSSPATNDEQQAGEVVHQAKRRKKMSAAQDVFDRAASGEGLERLVALQILFFMYDQPVTFPKAIEETIPKLESGLLVDDPQIVTWTMLLLSRFAASDVAAHHLLQDFWNRVKGHLRSAVAGTSTARAACLLLETANRKNLLTPRLDGASLLEFLFSGGRNGPGGFSDTALIMFISTLTSDCMDSDEVFEAFAMKAMDWLRIYWSLPSMYDRTQIAQLADHGLPEFVSCMMAAIHGSHICFDIHERCAEPHQTIRAEMQLKTFGNFSHYLGGHGVRQPRRSRPCVNLAARQMSKESNARLRHALFTLVREKCKDFVSTCAIYVKERSPAALDDLLTFGASISTALYASLAFLPPDSSIPVDVATAGSEIWQAILNLTIQERNDKTIARLTLVASTILRVQDPPDTMQLISKQASSMSGTLLTLLQDNLRVASQEGEDMDMLDSMDIKTSQSPQTGLLHGTTILDRHEYQTGEISNNSPICYLLDLSAQQALGHRAQPGKMSEVVDEIVNLDARILLSARRPIYELLQRDLTFSRNDAARLLKHVAAQCLQNNEFERSEVAICCCAKLLRLLAPLWTTEKEDDLSECAFDVYDWFVKKAVGKGIISPRASLEIGLMLDAVSNLAPTYGSEEDMPSPRTSVLRILNGGFAGLKYQLSPSLCRMFDRYILSEHSAIFNDIVDALPADPDNIEGIAVRFHVLSELGGRWHTVLRQATFHLFETATNVKELISLGSVCIRKLSADLKLVSPRELFAAFAAQIFFTWLSTGTIKQIPHQAFGYESLPDLIRNNESEVVAQVALRGAKERAQELAHLLNTSWTTLLTKHFAHAESYCLASQTSLPDKEQLFVNSESLIRKDLGSQAYVECVSQEMPAIISFLFRSLQDDHGVERALEKAHLTKPLSNLREICAFARSGLVLPAAQQPSFKSKFIVEEIAWLCKRIEIDITTLWTPAMLVYIYRSLLQDANPVLGPLHAASIVRKIRCVVCLGGENALRGYPLEMLLHNLRPFLTIFQCSEDTIGIYKYLLESGKPYLRSNLSFLSGISVSTFASLTAFVSSSQESTTQEIEFVSTMSKAKEFQKWFGRFLDALEPDEARDDRLDMFRQLVHHAKLMTQAGNSSSNTAEGIVLLNLLTDRAATQPLLKETHFYSSIRILCQDFSSRIDATDDILAGHHNLPRYTKVLSAILERASLPPSFHTWAAYILGRASSKVGPAALKLSKGTRSSVNGQASTISTSYQQLVRYLENLIWQDNAADAAAAEYCLQQIATILNTPAAVGVFGKDFNQTLFDGLRFHDFPCPNGAYGSPPTLSSSLQTLPDHSDPIAWAAAVGAALCKLVKDDSVLSAISHLCRSAPATFGTMLPSIVHIVLSVEMNTAGNTKTQLSELFSHILQDGSSEGSAVIGIILETMIYLRKCQKPAETSIAQRNNWLEIDYALAAEAAARCKLWHEALMLIEIQQAQLHLQSSRSTRRSTQSADTALPAKIATAFQNVDDPDFFYAGHKDSDLASVIKRLEHDSSSFKMLSFKSAEFDASIRSDTHSVDLTDTTLATARALSNANLQGVSKAVQSLSHGQAPSDLQTKTRGLRFGLFEWNMPAAESHLYAGTDPLKSLRALSSAADKSLMIKAIDTGLSGAVQQISQKSSRSGSYVRVMHSMALLSEARDVLLTTGVDDLEAFVQTLAIVDEWSHSEDIGAVLSLLGGREYVFGTIRRNDELQAALSLTRPQALLLEAQAVRQSLQVAQTHSASQFALNRATYLSRLAANAAEVGVYFEAASQFDLAKTLWSQGEASASVQILQQLKDSQSDKSQSITIERSEILAELGTKAADARLEPPDEVIAKYLLPAYKELGSKTAGRQAGKVLHNFAAFCDAQLQDPDSRDDYTRVEKIRETKRFEMRELERLMASRDGRQKEGLKQAYAKARTWFKLDDDEFQRLHANRETFILRCLENYLLSMKACDDFPNDCLRVLSIWLDQSHSERVNKTVHKYLQQVPTIKFAGLVNQLTSRLTDSQDDFSQILVDLMFRICQDHPYHSIYQLFAASKSKGAKTDDLASSRHTAATKLGEMLRTASNASNIWIAIHNACIAFVRTAQEKSPEKELKPGQKLLLRNLSNGAHLMRTVEGSSKRIPPPTMKIKLRADCDYSNVPVMTEFEPQISVAGGISAPKIVTVRGSDGSRNKMLLKGGNDDLRQDAIMEQVFEQVSNLLRDHRPTRQRKLGIRTYKVIPLVSNAGIIEFVQNTLALHDYLLPAHQHYFPKDFKQSKCRKEIADAQTKSLPQRVQAYRNVTANFHPVMRFFFMEKFPDPDEWFYKRLNYSRSTAAISILGHVLGLGDRHGHNILLDEKTGDVVHIDLGIAFEAGRVLPVPEVVPFRLTRNLVDGMGISGVEGVFRRCCNFTLEALRRDQESIMTILDVLRYDPLYSWSVSPVRLQKMQENQEAAAAAAVAANQDTHATGTSDGNNVAAGGVPVAMLGRREINEPSEADRALTVVAKKLGKSLSVEATVNELIRQATDERNLAVLYCGWAAYV